MLYFRMCNILKFTQNSLVVFIPYLLIYSQQLRHIAFMLMFSVLMVLIKQRSFFVIPPIFNHVKIRTTIITCQSWRFVAHFVL